MDGRQARGRVLVQAHGARIRPVEGDLWFVPASSGAGGYLVQAGSGQCSCPDGSTPERPCKHAVAVQIVRAALPPADAPPGGAVALQGPALAAPAPPARPPRGDLTVEEQARVRAGLRFAQRRAGGWEGLAKGTRLAAKTLKNVAYGTLATASVAVRLARFAGVPVDDVLQGRYPPVCPTCGCAPSR